MKRIAGAALVVALAWPQAAAAGLCGSRDDWHVKVALVAQFAGMECDGVDEIPDRHASMLLLGSGLDKARIESPACTEEIALAMLALKAEHTRDAQKWCSNAKRILVANPLTKPLVRAASARGKPSAQCTEINKAAALVGAWVDWCPGSRVTAAGQTMRDLGQSDECGAAHRRTFDENVQAIMRARKLDWPRAASQWCAASIAEHREQMRASGMKVWVER